MKMMLLMAWFSEIKNLVHDENDKGKQQLLPVPVVF